MYLNCNLKVKSTPKREKEGHSEGKKINRGKTPKFKTKRLELLLPPPKYSLTPNKKIITIKYATTSDLLGKLFLLQYS